MPFEGSDIPDISDLKSLGRDFSLEEGVYLLDFWSYSCPCCLKRSEALERIDERTGLEVVRVHSPELGFEYNYDNLSRFVGENNSFPVVQDDEERFKQAFGAGISLNQIIVEDGIVKAVNRQGFQSLTEFVEDFTGEDLDLKTNLHGVKEFSLAQSTGNIGNSEAVNFNGEKSFELPVKRLKDRIYLEGVWRQKDEFIEAVDGSLCFHTRFSGLGAVLCPGDGIKDVDVAMETGKVPHSVAGDDLRVEKISYVRSKTSRFYSLLSGHRGSSEVVLRPDKGTRIYSLGVFR